MKIRNSSRIMALALALMMIVPLISVPAFAEDPTPLFAENFENVENDDVFNTVVSNSNNANNPSISIKDIGGDHGKVYYYDYSNGVSKQVGTYDEGTLFIIKDRNGTPYPAKDLVVNADGTYTGKVVVDAVEYKFVNAKLNTASFADKTEIYTYAWSEGDLITDEEGNPVFDENDEPMYSEPGEVLGESAGEYYLATGQCVNAIRGNGNVAVPSWVKGAEDLEKTELTFSADYYFSMDWAGQLDVRLLDSENFELFRIYTKGGNTANVAIGLHPDTATKTNNTDIQIAKERWFNVSVYTNGATGDIEIYVNGKLAASGSDSTYAKVQMTNPTRGWNIGHTGRGNNAECGYAGFYMVDNLAIYEGKAGIPAESATPAYLNSLVFTNNNTSDGFGTGRAWDYDHSEYNGTAFKIDSDTYDEATGKDKSHAASVIDKNLYQNGNASAISADEAGDTVVLEADFFLVPGMDVKFEGQIKSFTADGYTAAYSKDPNQTPAATNVTKSWTTLYYVYSNANGASVHFDGMDPNGVIYNNVLPTGKWFTMSTVLNLKTGASALYVDGVLAATYDIYRGGHYCANITIGANNGYIAAKLSKMSGTAGHGGSYPKGYTDYVLVDNMVAYKDLSLMEAKDVVYFTEDYEGYSYSVGDKAIGAFPKGNVVGPKTATYAYAPDGDLALKLDLTPADTGTYTETPFFGYGARGYLATVELESFNPEDGMEVNFPKLTKVGSGMSATSTDKIVYYARVGSTVWIYMAPGNAVANEDGSNLEYKGVFATAPQEENGKYDLKYMECYQGGGNVDKYFKAYSPEYKYNAEAGANNTYLFSASYYVSEDACGNVESQLLDKWVDLYTLNLGDKTFRNRLNADVTGELLVNAWNKVDMVVTFVEDDVLFDIYLNGVYAHSHAKSDKSGANLTKIAANDWVIAKAGKLTDLEAIAALNGSVYVDDVSVTPVDTAKLQEVAIDETALTVVVDGVESALYNTTGKFYGTEIVAGDLFDAAAYAGIVATQDVASIRTLGPAGLRFLTNVDVELFAALQEVAKSVVLGTEIDAANKAEGVAPLMVQAYAHKGVFYNEDGTQIAGSIVNVKEKNLDRDFTGRGYAQVTLKSGVVVMIYSESVKTISLADQAAATLANEEAKAQLTAEEIALLEGYAAKAN